VNATCKDTTVALHVMEERGEKSTVTPYFRRNTGSFFYPIRPEGGRRTALSGGHLWGDHEKREGGSPRSFRFL